MEREWQKHRDDTAGPRGVSAEQCQTVHLVPGPRTPPHTWAPIPARPGVAPLPLLHGLYDLVVEVNLELSLPAALILVDPQLMRVSWVTQQGRNGLCAPASDAQPRNDPSQAPGSPPS